MRKSRWMEEREHFECEVKMNWYRYGAGIICLWA